LPLEPPPRDALGNVQPHDNAGISADHGIIRRISEQQLVIDEKIGQRRISSLAFKASKGPLSGMSVDLEQSIVDAGVDARLHVTTPRWIGSIRFLAGDLRAIPYQVGYDPLPANPHHGEVWGDFCRDNRRRLRKICEWYVPIESAQIGDE
jgi:hypothetical protein